jgi:hypothetical protein
MKIRIFLVFALVFSAIESGISSNIQASETCGAASASKKCAVLTVKRAVEYSKAVFVGEVIAEEKNGDVKTFKFKVEKYWKGEDMGELTVFVYQTPRYQSPFKEGGRFLVYAFAGEDGRLTVARCSRSKDARYAEDDLRELGEGKTPK